MIPSPKSKTGRDIASSNAVFYMLGGAGICFLAYIIGAIWTSRALFADGSFFFIQIANDNSAWPYFQDDKVNRLFSCLLNELPLSLGVVLGVVNLDVLRILFSIGCFLTPVAILAFAMSLAWRGGDIRLLCLIALSYVTCFMPSQIFIINPAFTAAAVAWAMVCYATLNLRLRWWDQVAALIFGIVSLRAHEGAIFTAPLILLLGTITLWRSRGMRVPDQLRRLRHWVMVMSAASGVFAAYRLLTQPTSPEASQYSMQSMLGLLAPGHIMQSNLAITACVVLGAIVVIVASFFRRAKKESTGKLSNIVLPFVGGGFAVLAVCAGARFYFDVSLAAPFLEYEYRFLIIFGVAAWFVLLVVLVMFRTTATVREQGLLLFLVAGGLAGHSLWQIQNNNLWSEFVGLSHQALADTDQPVVSPITLQQMTSPNDPALRYRWAWTWPAFGFSIQQTPAVTAMFAPEMEFQLMRIPGGDSDEVSIPYATIHGRVVNFVPLNQLCASAHCPFM